MAVHTPPLAHDPEQTTALRSLVEGTATETGERFFATLVENLAKALGTHGAWVTEYVAERRLLRGLAFWLGGQWIEGYKHPVDGTPCQAVIDGRRLVHYPDRILEIYPDVPELQQIGAVSYLGVPLLDLDGQVLGHLAVLDTRPMPEDARALALFRIFAARAAAELQRLRAEAEVREEREKLHRLVESAMDAIVEFDRAIHVTRVNPAAERIFGCRADQVLGRDGAQLLSGESRARLAALVAELEARPTGRQALWIPGGLTARRDGREEFAAEATLSRFEAKGDPFYAMILRSVDERVQAERTILSLTMQTAYLQEEIKALHDFEDMIGQSGPLQRVLEEVHQVAPMGTTVLILGETGTGKELVARAIHAASPRRDRPLVKVNCAAIPATLMESELFGHEKGAFTGATRRREGRFALADGGTILLDEVGELPLDLQAKLLRIIQEGELEPVGSARTRTVDVRILAATNRDLRRAVQAGDFREDLYFRLNVFPITLPPLRERGEDIALLACVFARRFARRMGKSIEPLSRDCLERLMAYPWPGNVRELMSVIERAVITSRDGRLSLDRALPEAALGATVPPPPNGNGQRVLTVQELEALERANLLRALERASWRVAGEHGAAQLLGMNPSTLNSRMKALGIRRPQSP
jgi:PAS domain S-box-containing protein